MFPPWRWFPLSTASPALIVAIATVKPYAPVVSRDQLYQLLLICTSLNICLITVYLLGLISFIYCHNYISNTANLFGIFKLYSFLFVISVFFWCVPLCVTVTFKLRAGQLGKCFTRHPACGAPASQSILGCHTACYYGMILNTLNTYLSVFLLSVSLCLFPPSHETLFSSYGTWSFYLSLKH